MAEQVSAIVKLLENKLGKSAVDEWTGREIAMHLDKEKFQEIVQCFPSLPTQIKLRLLTSFLHFTQRKRKELQTEMEEILVLGLAHFETSVAVLAEILQPFPSTGNVKMELGTSDNENTARVFNETLQGIVKELETSKNTNIIPKEVYYLNPSVANVMLGKQDPPMKHFNLRKEPPSRTFGKGKAAGEHGNTTGTGGDSGRKRKRSPSPELEVGIGVRINCRPTKVSFPRRKPIQFVDKPE